MSDQQPDVDEAFRWRSEADDELRAAEIIAEHDALPDRIAGFHAHLAAEKALKALVIRRGVPLPRIHDLVGLRALLPEADQQLFADNDLRVLNPWTIDGRYPADRRQRQRRDHDGGGGCTTGSFEGSAAGATGR